MYQSLGQVVEGGFPGANTDRGYVTKEVELPPFAFRPMFARRTVNFSRFRER